MLPTLILTIVVTAASGILEEASSNPKQVSTNEPRGLPVVGDIWGPVFTQAPYVKEVHRAHSIQYYWPSQAMYYWPSQAMYYWPSPKGKQDIHAGYIKPNERLHETHAMYYWPSQAMYYWPSPKGKQDIRAGYIKPSERLHETHAMYIWPSPKGKQDIRAGYIKPNERLHETHAMYIWPSPKGKQDVRAGYIKPSERLHETHAMYYWPSPKGKQDVRAGYIKPSERLHETHAMYIWPSPKGKQDARAGYIKPNERLHETHANYIWPSTKGKQDLLAGQVKSSEIFTTKKDLDEYILSAISDNNVVVQLDPATLEGKYLEVISSKVIPADAVKMVCHSYKTRPAFCHGLPDTNHNFKLLYSMVRDVDNGNLFPAVFTSHKGCARENGQLDCYWLTHVSEIIVLDKRVV